MITLITKPCPGCGRHQEWIVSHPRPPFSVDDVSLNTRRQRGFKILNAECWCKACSSHLTLAQEEQLFNEAARMED